MPLVFTYSLYRLLAGVPGVARETPISRHSSRPVTVTRDPSPSPVTRPSVTRPVTVTRHRHPSPSPVTRHRHRPVPRPVTLRANPLYAVIFDRWGRCYKWKLFTTVAYTICVIFSKSPRLRGTPYWIVGHKPTPYVTRRVNGYQFRKFGPDRASRLAVHSRYTHTHTHTPTHTHTRTSLLL